MDALPCIFTNAFVLGTIVPVFGSSFCFIAFITVTEIGVLNLL